MQGPQSEVRVGPMMPAQKEKGNKEMSDRNLQSFMHPNSHSEVRFTRSMKTISGGSPLSRTLHFDPIHVVGLPQMMSIFEILGSSRHPSSTRRHCRSSVFCCRSSACPVVYSTMISTPELPLISSLPRLWWPFCLLNPVPRSAGPLGCLKGPGPRSWD